MKIRETIQNKKEIISIVLGVVFLTVFIIGFVWFFIGFEDRKIEKLSRDHPQGEKFLNQYREARLKIEKDPQDAGAYFDIAFVKTELGDYQGAVQSYRKCLEINPDNIVVLNNLGNVYISIGDYNQAESAFYRSLGVNQGYVSTYYALVDLYQSHMPEKKQKIEEVLSRGLGVMPSDQNLLALSAGHYRDTGQIEKAIEIYEKILTLRPDDQLLKEEIESLKKQWMQRGV